MIVTTPARGITYDGAHKRFSLNSASSSYIFRVAEDGELIQEHFGARLELHTPSPPCLQHAAQTGHGWNNKLDLQLREYPDLDRSDFRHPAVQISTGDHSISELKYHSHEILKGKPDLPGLPSTFGSAEDVQTLHVILRDAVSGLEVTLRYSVFLAFDVFVRSATFRNKGAAPLTIQQAASFSLDLPPNEYDMLQLSGNWIAERKQYRTPLRPGVQSIQARCGASSHHHNPFVAILNRSADEHQGEVLGCALVYSGAFVAAVEESPFGLVRVSLGINPEQFSWILAPGGSFNTPECVAVHSMEGLGGMSRRFHDLFRNHLSRSEWTNKLRPALINNWEATYFNFDSDGIVEIAKEASKVGVELLVLDDGWFGVKHPRNNDHAGLGDWVVNEKKLPGGLTPLAERINALNMRFGLWVEPGQS